MKANRATVIRAEDVACVFDQDRIRELAHIGKLSATADLDRLGDAVREAVRDYARKVREPNVNQVHDEIEALHRDATGQRFEDVARRLESLPAGIRDYLNSRGSRPGFRACYGGSGVALPFPDALRDPEQRKRACEIVRRLCTAGGRIVPNGRRRPTGRRSREWQALLHAPDRTKHPPRRQAELDLVMWLRVACLHATGHPPAATAHHDHPGPFARMIKVILRIAGAGHANAVELINELHRRQRIHGAENKRRSPPVTVKVLIPPTSDVA